jgi:uncharacterized protein with HEPN domain
MQDILDAIERVETYTAGMTLAAFEANGLVVDAVARNLGIIGEAARYVPDEVASSDPSIPWPRIRAMRNFLIHVYHGVRLRTVWETVRDDLPPLKEKLRALIGEA